MDADYIVKRKTFDGEMERINKAFSSFDDALKFCCEWHDQGNDEDMEICNTKRSRTLFINCYELDQDKCPECGKPVRHMDLMQTYDCYGIPFRWICPKCYHRIMDNRGYDGERYTEADECIDFDY